METLIEDYATGKPVKGNPEEQYRQLYEKILIDDLGYPKEHIDIEVNIQRGSKRDSERADIVVYNSSRKAQDNIYIIIEIETPKKKYDFQAFSYATATLAPYCVWFAGYANNSDGPVVLYRDIQNEPTKFNEIPSLPRYGETYDTIGLYRKGDLKPAKALKLLFSRIHHKLYGSGPIKREENVAQEVIKLLFCKIIDETSPNDLCEFRITPNEMQSAKGLAEARKRIEKLYSVLLNDPDFGQMFAGEALEYDDDSIGYIISELQGIAFLHPETNTDALGDAYEVFLPSTLKGESGQFFTPREVVRFAINFINPRYDYNEKIFDPACGSGGFLSIAIEHLRKQIYSLYEDRGFSKDRLEGMLKEYAGKYIFGTDIDPLLYRIAKSYMAIVGDGKTNIFNFDSLEPENRYPQSFTERIKPGSVDVILTNPPFGTKIDDTREYVLEQYELGHYLDDDGKVTSEMLGGQDPDKLFLEKDIKYLKEATPTENGGRMAIVLPRQNLSGAEHFSVQLRKWLLGKVKINAVIDLPREAFQPYTGTKTSIIFLEKVYKIEDDYPIFMGVSEAVGHDRRGNPLYRKDNQGRDLLDESGNRIIWNDLPDILSEWESYKNGVIPETSNPSCFVISSKDILEDPTRRLDAWYWDPNKNKLAKTLENALGEDVVEIVKLGDLTVQGGIFYPGRHKRNYVEESEDSVPFYSGTQILQMRPYDIKYQPKNYTPARNHFVHKDWILVTRSGSTGRVRMTDNTLDGCMVSEHVIRVICNSELIDPYYVYAYLASEKIGKVLLEKGIYASVVDHISPEFVSSIPIARLNPEKEKEIADQVRVAEELRARANDLLFSEINDVENLLNASGVEVEE